MEQLGNELQQLTNIPHKFNCCNVNFYPNSSAKLGQHADNEALFGNAGDCKYIVSVSFGGTREPDVPREPS